ncbi:MAG: glycoside hydrolase family 15 protein [Bacteroidales bacterium]
MNNLNYGVIGNCHSAALVSSEGSIDWCCLPDFDSPSIFAKILDKNKGGNFSFIVDKDYSITQKYIHWTNILCTEFKSAKGVFQVIDFMPRYKTNDISYFRPPEIYRIIKHISGAPSFKINYNPTFNYAQYEACHNVEEQYIRTYSKNNPADCIYLYSNINFDDILQQKEITLTENKFLLLTYNQKLIDIDINRAYLEYERTKVYWLNWTNRSKKHELYTDVIIRSLLVLKIMTYEPTGAILAALTTSLPEAIGESRNWDYRFCWLRDASMSIDTLLQMGHIKSAQSFLHYIKKILKSKDDMFQIMYGIRGERILSETELPHLAGYENSKPVRIGNAAYNQQQNDVFGYLMDVIYKYYAFFPGTLDEIEELWEVVRNIARSVIANWEKPDKGIWEFRSGEKFFVFSKIMCWVAMDRATKIATLLNKTKYVKLWQETANEIKADVLKKGWKEKIQSFSQTYCNTELDASLLLMAEFGFISYEDEKYRKTVLAVKNALLNDDLMYRYKITDDFGEPKTSFTICTCWLIQALFRIGMRDEAKNLFDNLLKYGNHLGLFSEGIDFKTKRLLGNFPQAYSHLALINCATLFSKEKFTSKFVMP